MTPWQRSPVTRTLIAVTVQHGSTWSRLRNPGILPSASQGLFTRLRNLTKKKLSAKQRKAIKTYESELVGSIDLKSIEKKRDWEREFRAETDGRGIHIVLLATMMRPKRKHHITPAFYLRGFKCAEKERQSFLSVYERGLPFKPVLIYPGLLPRFLH